jgi:hypothetical protein
VTNIKLNITVDERLALDEQPAIAEWYRAGIEERRPLLLEAKPPAKPKPKSSFGFGLKKSGFSLNNKKASEEESSSDDDQTDQSAHTLPLKAERDEIVSTLSTWAGWQHHQQIKFGAPAIYLGVGSITMGKRSFGPLLLIPITLKVNEDDVPFELHYVDGPRRYVPAVKRILDRKNIELPELPSISDDFDPSAWIDDVTSALVPHDSINFTSKSWIARCSFQRELPETWPHHADESETNRESLSLPFIPASRQKVDPLPQAHRKILDEIEPGTVSWIQSEDQKAKGELLRNIMVSSLAHEQRILLLGTSNDHLTHWLEQCSKDRLSPLILPLYYGYSSHNLLEQIADIVDANWDVTQSKQQFKAHVTDQAVSQATETVHNYQKALFEPHGKLGFAPATLAEELLSYRDLPSLPVSIDGIKNVSPEDVQQWTKIGQEYAKLNSDEIDYDSYLWSDTTLTRCSEDDLIDINESLEQVIRSKDTLFSALLDAQEQTGLPVPNAPNEIEDWIGQTEFFDSAPKLNEKQLRPDSLQHIPKGDEILQLLEKAQKYYQSVSSYFFDKILEEHLEGVVSRLRKQSLSAMRFLNYRYRKDISRLKQYRKDQDSDDDVLFWEKLKDAKILKQIRKKLRNYEHEASRLFDESWNSYKSDINDLKRQYRWLKKFAEYTEGQDAANTLEIRSYVASLKRMTNDQKDKIRSSEEQFRDQIARTAELAELKDDSDFYNLYRQNWHKIDRTLKKRKQALSDLPAWLSYKHVLTELDRPDLSDLVDKIESHDVVTMDQWEDILRQTVLRSLLNDAKNERSVLQDIPSSVLSGSLSQMTDYRQSETATEIGALIQEHLDKRQKLVSDPDIQAGLNVLQHELKKQRRLQPKERLLNQTHGTLKTFAPVWMLRYDQLDDYQPWIDDFNLIIAFDPNQDDLNGIAALADQEVSTVVFHSDSDNTFQFNGFAQLQEGQLSDGDPPSSETEDVEESSPSPSPEQPVETEDGLIEELLQEIDPDDIEAAPSEAVHDASEEQVEQKQIAKVKSIPLPARRNYLPPLEWPQLSTSTSKKLLNLNLSYLEKVVSDQKPTKTTLLWCDPNTHKALWERICGKPELANQLLTMNGPQTSPQILSSALQIPTSLQGLQVDQTLVTVPKLNSGSNAAPSFGFKKTKEQTQKVAFEQLPDSRQLWQVTTGTVRLASDSTANIKEYQKQWSDGYLSKDVESDEILANAVREHLGEHWNIQAHPQHPYELAIYSDEYDALKFYVWSDLLQLTPYAYLPDYFAQLRSSAMRLIHFPAIYYPERLHEWLITLQQTLQQAYDEYHADQLKKQEEAQKAESITREVNDQSDSEAKPEKKGTQDTTAEESEAPSGPYDLPSGLKEYELPEDSPFETVEDQQRAQLPQLKKLRPSEVYRLHEGQTLGTKMDFFDATDNEMQKLILDIVEIEAPIHWRNLLRCVASYWQIQRINQNVERVVLRNIQQLADRDRVFLKDGCLYDDENYTFKLRDRSATIEYHRADELPLDECETALYEILNQRSPIQEQTLLRSGATLLGFEKFDRMLEHQFRKALYRLGEQDVIKKGPNGYELAPSYHMNESQ